MITGYSLVEENDWCVTDNYICNWTFLSKNSQLPSFSKQHTTLLTRQGKFLCNDYHKYTYIHHSITFLFYGINLILNKTESKQYHSIAVIKNMWSVVLSDRTSMLNSPWIAFFDKMYNACSFLECTCSYFLSNGVHTRVVKAFGKWCMYY